jgi:Uma2 family endonuclease
MPSIPSRAAPDLPDLDDRLVEPGTRFEMFDGELVYVPPADGPHGDRHSQLASLIEAHTSTAYVVSIDLLTRTSKVDDIAPDVSVRPAAPDPATGRRQLPEIAFEIVSTESIGLARRRAAKLTGRGTRRVFAIDVETSHCLEWCTPGEWIALEPGGLIEDTVLVVPLPIESLIHTAKSDNAVARALLAKHNQVLEEKAASDRAKGQAEAVITFLTTRGVPLDAAARERILAEQDPARLEDWIARAVTCTTADDLFAEP